MTAYTLSRPFVAFAAVLAVLFAFTATPAAARTVSDTDTNGSLRCTLRLDDDEIEEGDSTRLSWTSNDADEARLESDTDDFHDFDVDEDDVDHDSIRVSPDEDTTYTMTFEDEDGDEVECKIDLSVEEDENNDSDDDKVSCSPAEHTVGVNQPAVFTADGGNGRYVWTTPDGTWTGDRFTVTRYIPGTISVRVSSDGESETCSLEVTGTTVPYYPPTAPGFPNTGGEGVVTPALLAMLLAALPLGYVAARGIKGVVNA